MPTTPDLTIYFDGACPLCAREIAHYLRRDRAGRLAARDIAADPAPLAPLGITQAAAIAALHVRHADGRMARGAAAFVAIWERLPRWRWLAATLRRVPGALALAEAVYRLVARHRVRVVRVLCGDGRCAR
jgi:predicted DCC family thiol-disulfide oxidoreductase YuxK